MGRPLFLPHTLFNMSKFIVMGNLINVKNLEEKSVCEEAEWGVVKPRMSFSLASSQSLAFSSLQITQNTKNLYLPWHLTQILIQQIFFH